MNIIRIHRHWPSRAAVSRAASTAPTAAWQPAVDVREETDRFVLVADLPGIDPQAITLEADAGTLVLRGERAASPGAEDGRHARVERRTGAFERRFTLPDTADIETISATGQHGVLEIIIPKQAVAGPRRIAIGGQTMQ